MLYLVAVPHRHEYQGDLQYDLGNMMASDHGPLNQARFRDDTNKACLEVATQITQSLVARLFELPSEAALVRLWPVPFEQSFWAAKTPKEVRTTLRYEAFCFARGLRLCS